MGPQDFNKITNTTKKQTSVKASSLLPGTNNLIVSQDIQIESFKHSYLTNVHSPVSHSTQSSMVLSKLMVCTPKDLKADPFKLHNNLKTRNLRNGVSAFPLIP